MLTHYEDINQDGAPTLGIHGQPSSQFVRRTIGQAAGLSVSSAPSDAVESLDFLEAAPRIESLSVFTDSGLDLAPLERLENLRWLHLNVAPDSHAPRWDRLRTLRWLCVAPWHDVPFEGVLNHPGVELLEVNGFMRGLDAFAEMPRLTWLDHDTPAFRDLSGIGALKHLIGLRVSTSRKLVALEGVQEAKWIRALHLGSTSNLCSLDGLEELSELRSLVLAETAKVKTLEPLRGLPKVGYVYLGERKLNATDVSVLKSLPELRHVWTYAKTRTPLPTSQVIMKLIQSCYWTNRGDWPPHDLFHGGWGIVTRSGRRLDTEEWTAMGKWGTEPWESDGAADWLQDAIAESGLAERVEQALGLDVDDHPEETRAAAWVVGQVANKSTWPFHLLVPHLLRAIDVLEELALQDDNQEEEAQAQLQRELDILYERVGRKRRT